MFIFNGKTLKDIKYNAMNVAKVIYNGITVWVNKVLEMVSGNPAKLTNSTGDALQNYYIEGRSIQEGVPTPDAPVEIKSVGDYDATTGKYKIPIVVSGENYYSSDKLSFPNAQMVEVFDGGFIGQMHPNASNTQPGNMTYSSGWVRVKVDLPEGHKCYVSYDIEFLEVIAGEFDFPINHAIRSSNAVSTSIKEMNKTYSVKAQITIASDGYISLSCNSCKIKVTNLRITDNDKRAVTTNILLDAPLRKVGDYADMIDFEKGVVVRNVGEIVFTGEESFDDGKLMSNAFVCVISNKIAGNALSTHFINKTPLPSTTERYWGYIGISSLKYSGIGFFTVNSPYNLNGFKQYLSEQYSNGTPVKVSYIHATPEEEEIELPAIETIEGTNIFEIDTTIQPNKVEVSYYRKG